MDTVECVRCKSAGEAITLMPHKGPLGEEIQAKICARCWEAWNKESVKIINEHRLNLSEASARAFLSTQMKIFLTFIPPPPEAPPFQMVTLS